MKNRLLTGIITIIIGLVTAIGPLTIFSVCGPMENGSFMKCHWTARAELGIGILIVLLGVALVFLTAKQIRIGISTGIALFAILEILIPNKLIGVCGGEHMQCHALTLPTLTLLGVGTFLVAILNAFYLAYAERKERENYAVKEA
jgi:preprotein translocase subunit SecY